MDKDAKTSGEVTARDAILAAFRDILLEGGYENCRVLDIVERSGVARSTFYEHFQNRKDLLQASLRVRFEVLAELVARTCDTARVAVMLDHIAENRALMKSLISDPGLEMLIGVLAEMLESRAALTPHVAHAIAAAQLALLSQWLDGKDVRTAVDVARTMRNASVALRAL